MRILVASAGAVLVAESDDSGPSAGLALERWKPACLAVDSTGRIWCGTFGHGVFTSEDGGESWSEGGLAGHTVTAIAVGPDTGDGNGAGGRSEAVLYAGTEPSTVFRSDDGGATWRELDGLLDLPSAPTWSFPPRPQTHHVRWIATHPSDPERVHVAIEAGALIRTADGGQTWEDRVTGSPIDSHTIATHPRAPSGLWCAAGDGWFESDDGGTTWRSPEEGLADGYLWSVAVDAGDPGVVVISGSQGPWSAHDVSRAESRIYRREDGGRWRRVDAGLPEPRGMTAAVLAADPARASVFWAASNHGVFVSEDGGVGWSAVALDWPHSFTRERVLALAIIPG